MNRLLCLTMLIAGCATSDDATGVAEQASSAGAICANPADPAYGATLNNGTDDDTGPINKAVCAALCPAAPSGCTCTDPTLPGYGSHAVCLPAGELDVKRPTAPGVFWNIPLFNVDRLAFYGQGPASVLAMHGTGTGSCSNPCSGGTCPFSDWKMISIRGAAPPPATALKAPGHLEIRDLTMTSTGVDGFDKDSTRFVEFADQVTNTDDLLIKNVRMTNACGDHLYAIGGDGDTSTGTRTLGLRVIDSTFGHAGRRGVVIKHGVKRVVISNNTFETDGGAIDFDPSSSVTSTSEVIITNNTFRSLSAASIVLAGESNVSNPPASNLLVANNVMFGPGIIGGGIRNVEIRNNTIFNTLPAGGFEIDRGQVERLDISNNSIVNTSTTAQYAISVISKGTTVSPDVRISGNTIVQGSQNPAIHVQDVQHQVVTNNVISMTWTNAAAAAAAGIRSQTDHFNVQSVQLSGNSVTGMGAALSFGIFIDLTSATCGNTIPPIACTLDTQCATGGFCHAGVCGCAPTLQNLQADRNFVTGATKGIVVGVGTFGSPAVAKGFLAAPPMIANNDLDPSVTTPISIAGLGLPRAYVIGGNQGGPIQLVGDASPLANGVPTPPIPEVIAPNGSTYVVRGGTSAVTPALYFRENNTWVAQ